MNDLDRTKAAISRLLCASVSGIEALLPGRNSRTYHVVCEDGRQYAVKHYVPPTGPRRLETEHRALKFLRNHGVLQVPRPVAADMALRMGACEWVEGQPCSESAVEGLDIDAAVSFVATLARLGQEHGCEWDAPAAEAFFSLNDVLSNIDSRLAILESVTEEGAVHDRFREFVRNRLRPWFGDASSWGRKVFEQAGLSFEHELPPAERILSPSDFGFHNALRREDGTLVFVDFEYFGWDDPAKTVADFVLHPGMELSRALRWQFAQKVCESLPEAGSLAVRLPVAHVLFAIKWCEILLNEFVPEHRNRRRFAGDARDEAILLGEQLAKAKSLCESVGDTYRESSLGA